MPRGDLSNYDFNRDELNMIIKAAKRLDRDVFIIADWAYGASILNHWELSDWSVEKLVAGYTADKLLEYG